MATLENINALLTIKNYVAYGNPTKKLVEDLIRKRGYLKTKENKRQPISDNVIIEELLGEQGLICIEDLIDAFWRCKSQPAIYKAAKDALWPIQLAPLKETSDKANVQHDAKPKVVRKVTTRVHKGGYLGYMGKEIDSFVEQLI